MSTPAARAEVEAREVRALADDLHDALFARQPFAATAMGVPGHDDEVPDVTPEGDARWGEVLAGLEARARTVDPEALSGPDRVTLRAVEHGLRSERDELDARAVEHTVTVLGGHGLPALLALAGRTTLATPEQARDHLERTRRSAGYLDAHAARLRDGAAAGRLPVATLVQVVLAQTDGYLSGDEDPLASVAAPAGWDGAAAWSAELADVVGSVVRPAAQRWRDTVAGLPVRPDEQCGLVHLPGGAEDYEKLVAVHTTLPLRAQQVHDLGRTAVAELVARMTDLGAQLGLTGWDEVREAVRASGAGVAPAEAMAGAAEAVRRAEEAVVGVFPEPLPPPCEVQPMSTHLARAGMPPHYTPPSPERGMLGTYWFNAEQPGAGSGWDLEATAFHEAVPGHHLQVSRQLGLPDSVPALQRHAFVTAHGEGWGLYAEVLAGELGLYPSVQAQLGALGAQLFRAARLVVDTGIHARGWGRARALEEMRAITVVPEEFVVSEVNRYIGMPGQALAYLVGQRELLRLRDGARARLGDRFDLAGFHAAVLDSGTLPLPAVALAVEAWVAEG